jgi:hypothetical protein
MCSINSVAESTAVTHVVREASERLLRVLTSTLFCSIVAPAMAGVGQPLESIERDAAAIGGHVTEREGTGKFSVREIVAPGDTRVREYVSPSGIVFAAAWIGQSMPDLKVLLASYYARYALQATANEHGAKVLVVDSPDFVLRIVKLPRSMAGAAYLPSLMPEGVSAGDLN